MKARTRLAATAMALAIALVPMASIAAPDINSAVIIPRVFNDCPGSLFSSVNNYPALISMTDVNQGCLGFANLHLWRLSEDGLNAAEFENGEAFRFCADLQITGSGEAEAGLLISPWWSETDGRLNVRTTDGEIAAFGGRLPFYSFSDPAGYNMHYVKGDVLHLEIIYRPNGLTEASPATIEYIVNGNSSGPLPFDMGNPAEDPPHGLWGILTPTKVGGYFQYFLSESAPSEAVTVNWSNICYEELENILFACPRGLGFWRQQCVQRGNGSTKICQAGMERLWQCVLSNTDIVEWRSNDGSLVTTTSLLGLGDEDAFDELCSQLEGPRPMRNLDRAEIEYLLLQLNICAGALSPNIEVMNGFDGTIGEALDSLENAINTGEDVGYWTRIVGSINDNLNLDAEYCPDSDSLFRHVEPCTTSNGHPMKHASREIGGLEVRAYPNPVIGGSTSIVFRVPDSSSPSGVDVAVFDLSGRLVKKLVSDTRAAGVYSIDWDLRDEGGAAVASGMYFYRVIVGDAQFTRKLLISQ